MRARFARAYAQAIVGASGGGDAATRQLRDELARFAQALEVSPRLRAMASNPGIPMDAKKRVVSEIADRLQIGERARKVLALLLENFRLVRLDAVVDALDDLLRRRLGIVKAEVRSAIALDEAQRQRLAGVLAERLDSQIELELEVEPELLGGFVALIGSDRFDASLRGQLERLGAALAEGVEA